jgi:PAS domain S-box-containing protein
VGDALTADARAPESGVRMEPAERSRFFQTVLRCVADGVFTVDREWHITSFNRAAERITGIPAERALGKRCAEVFHANICEHGCAIRQTLETGREVIDQPACILNRRGRAVPISVSSAVLRAEDGTLLGAVETFRDLSAIEQLRREIHGRYSFQDIIGKSEAFQRIFAILPDIAASESTVLLEAPSGSGKELLARAIHTMSARARQPYVVVNCGTLPPALVESELFGYLRGAFTDAKHDKPGRIALAEGGTVFFDEIGDLAPATQVKLLRLLQQREYEPLGGAGARRANVRIVAATNQRLAELVSQGRFRDDLYFRLAVVRLTIPPLAERREDIPLLVEHFVQRFNAKQGKRIQGVTPAVMEILMRHEFPGNARELENAIEYAFVLCRNGLIDREHLPDDILARSRVRAGEPDPAPAPLRLREAETIRDTLARNQGRVAAAARELRISRTTLWRKMQRYGIRASEFAAH